MKLVKNQLLSLLMLNLLLILLLGCVTTPNVRLLDERGVSRIIEHLDETSSTNTTNLVGALVIGLGTYIGNQVRKKCMRS